MRTENASRTTRDLPYRKGDTVRVRSQEEILATLDTDGTVGGMPFMPEMLQFAGQEFTVYAPVHKTCDAINLTGTSRQMEKMLHLEAGGKGLRCDGSAHGGCQAGCMLFWREEWVERPGAAGRPADAAAPGQGSRFTAADPSAATETTDDSGGTVFRCQATDINKASTHISGFEPTQYVTDVRSGNVRLRTVLAGLAILLFNRYQQLSRRLLPAPLRIRQGLTYPFYKGTGTGRRTAAVDLQPGDLVEIRGRDEIMDTLGATSNANAGLWFDPEMVPVCGRRARVERRVERIINERTGKMLKLSDCVVLEDVICTGFYRKFCQRAVPMYWRSAWLRPVGDTDGNPAA